MYFSLRENMCGVRVPMSFAKGQLQPLRFLVFSYKTFFLLYSLYSFFFQSIVSSELKCHFPYIFCFNER